MFKKSLLTAAPVLPGGWQLAIAAKFVGVLEDCGLTFTAAGITGTLALFWALKGIVAFGGPIPLTPGVVAGLSLWLAFLTVALVHTCVDAILVFSGEPLV